MTNKYKNQKVLILGLGINQGGLGAARFFAKAGAQVLVTDLKNEEQLKPSLDELKEFKNIKYQLGEHKYEDIDWADLVIRNQSLKPDNEYRLYAEQSGKKVETDVGIFLEFVKPEQIIGITGTKGKSTTSSLIYEVLRKGEGLSVKGEEKSIKLLNPLPLTLNPDKVLYAGNIGKSVLDTIEHVDENTLVVLEISSFQLEAFDKHQISPHIAVITNIYPDHLDYYGSMDKYIESKRIIAKYQKPQDYLFIWKQDEETNLSKFQQDLSGKIIKYDTSDLPSYFIPNLPGMHNKVNYAAALAVSKVFDVEEQIAISAMEKFEGVPFRLQLIKDWQGIKIYNDTAATGPIATLQALNSFKNPIIIVGGVDKGLPYEQLAFELDRKAKAIYFLEGAAAEKLKSLLRILTLQRSTYFDLETLLKDLKKEAKTGDTVLFSPGAASFNLFQNEFDRGRKFNLAVEKIFR